MKKQDFIDACHERFLVSELNYVPKDKALSEELIGAQIFDLSLIGFATADDARFAGLQDESVVGPHFRLPHEWLPHARSVVLFFFPIAENLRESNRLDACFPSNGWLNARIEGQAFINAFSAEVAMMLEAEGFRTLAPTLDPAYVTTVDEASEDLTRLYSSNWSERHVAYICGLGTFGLSGSLITAQGTAGRMTSLVTEAPFEPSARRPARFDEDCIRCGACEPKCPFGAIVR